MSVEQPADRWGRTLMRWLSNFSDSGLTPSCRAGFSDSDILHSDMVSLSVTMADVLDRWYSDAAGISCTIAELHYLLAPK